MFDYVFQMVQTKNIQARHVEANHIAFHWNADSLSYYFCLKNISLPNALDVGQLHCLCRHTNTFQSNRHNKS